ncbi:hypothetical protein [Burkholderia pseudomallei]|uniref:hypothetical protein n=1 Tax=Burkholderia pseudomallei TaxID=28450 RepID=UPI0018C77468|nr:hypothetical protein [Burkholderia pseudomallei]MBG1252201.1 hypothetical protein [Burkholderia pseudomallei]
MSKILSKADIFAAQDLKTETVDVSEWGGAVIICTMTGAQRDSYEQSLMKRGDDGKYTVDTENMRAKLVVYTAVDEQGNALFTADDLTALAGKNAAVIERLALAAQRLNGLSRDSVDDAKKNSETTTDATSSFDSPQPSA